MKNGGDYYDVKLNQAYTYQQLTQKIKSSSNEYEITYTKIQKNETSGDDEYVEIESDRNKTIETGIYIDIKTPTIIGNSQVPQNSNISLKVN